MLSAVSTVSELPVQLSYPRPLTTISRPSAVSLIRDQVVVVVVVVVVISFTVGGCTRPATWRATDIRRRPTTSIRGRSAGRPGRSHVVVLVVTAVTVIVAVVLVRWKIAPAVRAHWHDFPQPVRSGEAVAHRQAAMQLRRWLDRVQCWYDFRPLPAHRRHVIIYIIMGDCKVSPKWIGTKIRSIVKSARENIQVKKVNSTRTG